MNELALFAGAGGCILGGHLMGWKTVCAVEIEDYPRKVLLARQRDGILPRFPIWDDVTTFDGREWRGRVDVVSGGFPCQNLSTANKQTEQDGIDGEQSGLWAEMARVVGEVQPRFIFVENSPRLIDGGLGRVLRDLASLGYDARWGVFSAADVGALHIRERIWILAYPNKVESEGSNSRHLQQAKGGSELSEIWGKNRLSPELVSSCRRELDSEWTLCSDTNGEIDAVAEWVDRAAAIGNGQVPGVVRLAWETLKGNK